MQLRRQGSIGQELRSIQSLPHASSVLGLGAQGVRERGCHPQGAHSLGEVRALLEGETAEGRGWVPHGKERAPAKAQSR